MYCKLLHHWLTSFPTWILTNSFGWSTKVCAHVIACQPLTNHQGSTHTKKNRRKSLLVYIFWVKQETRELRSWAHPASILNLSTIVQPNRIKLDNCGTSNHSHLEESPVLTGPLLTVYFLNLRLHNMHKIKFSYNLH